MDWDAREWAAAVRRALVERHVSQAELAKYLRAKPAQVSDWLRDKHVPRAETVRMINEFLKLDVVEDAEQAGPQPESKVVPSRLYVSSPITAMTTDAHSEHYAKVAAIVEAASHVVDDIYWPGEQVGLGRKLRAAGVVTEENLAWLASAGGLLYVQLEELHGASGSTIELGIALGRKLRTTVVFADHVHRPFMLSQGFEALARERDDLPKAQIYSYSNIDDAVDQIKATGGPYFGLPDLGKLF